MAGRGYISIHRQITDHWLWEDKPFSYGQAWIDLILLANHEDRQKPYKGQMKTYHRGDVNVSLTFLADRWGWSRQKVRRFINLLENAEMVTAHVTTNDTTISLVNYSKFQSPGTTRVTTICNNDYNSEGNSEGNTNNNDNNFNNGNKVPAPRKESYFERRERFERELEEWANRDD